MEEYIWALKNAKNEEEKLKILSRLGISSLAREKDLKSYYPRKPETDFDLLKGKSKEIQEIANTITTRKKLIEYIKTTESAKKLNAKTGYRKCLEEAQKKNLKLCPEGYCTAKEKFEVYPSAYANGYAVQVCKGTKPDAEGNYTKRYSGEKEEGGGLDRWFQEEWVNVCERDKNGKYKPCGRKKANLEPSSYPYCRPLNKLPGTTVKTVDELSENERNNMCEEKRSYEQGIDSKPTRVFVKK